MIVKIFSKFLKYLFQASLYMVIMRIAILLFVSRGDQL